jgi:pyruvate/2-oxoglutarate dehydrogenase complex dihydrolipoamide dehydrogenase (E3) component
VSEARGEGVYNVVVIGGGTAGLVTAAGTAGLGGRVALVERGRMGGECLNTGCVPSKALIASARLARRMRTASRLGLRDAEPRFDFEHVMARVRERRARLAPHDSRDRFESLGVHVFHGEARFTSSHEVEVDGRRLRGRNFVIATGSRAAIPDVPGLAAARPYTNETIFDELNERPARLIVIGGGPIGCELGQALQNLGVHVTLLEASARLLDKEDEEAAQLVRRSLVQDGVRVETSVTVRRVERTPFGSRVYFERDGSGFATEAEALLVAAGRAANVDGLQLEKAGVAFTKRGVTVDRHLRTSQPHIYAAGDVAGSYQFTHLADHHARVIVRNILLPWWKARVDTRALPWCTYTTPEIGRVGMGEDEALRRGMHCERVVQPLNGLDRAVLESDEEGFAKVLLRPGGDTILGATVVGAHAGELVHEIALAIQAGLGLRSLAGTIHAYPSWSELLRKLADTQQRRRLTPVARSATAWLYRRRREALP